MIEYFNEVFEMDPNLSIHKSLHGEKRRLQRQKALESLEFNREFAQEQLDRTAQRSKFKTDEVFKNTCAKNLEKRNVQLQNKHIDEAFVNLLSDGFGRMVAEAADVNPRVNISEEISKHASETFKELLSKGYFKLEDAAKDNPHFRIYLSSIADMARDTVAGNEEITNATVLKETFENDVADVINRKVLAMLNNEKKIEAMRKEEIELSKNAAFPKQYMKAQAGRFNTFFKQILDNTIKEVPSSDKMYQFMKAVGTYTALEALYTLKLVDRSNFKLNTFGNNAFAKAF